MKKSILSLLMWSLPFLLLAQGSNEYKGIKWVEGLTWEQVKEKAKTENKFIFVDAYTTWCGPCKMMDKDVYPSKNVGAVLNQQFVSVKVQMDQTPNDNSQIKQWYTAAKAIFEQYNIEGYPTFLFLTSDGKLVHKGIGFKDTSGLISLAKHALTDPIEWYKKSTKLFIDGQLEYSFMPRLALEALNNKDQQLGSQVAKVYKEQYLDKLKTKDLFQKDALNVLSMFAPILFTTKDRYFNLFYNYMNVIDDILGEKISKSVIRGIIQKKYITDNFYKDGKPIISFKPSWQPVQREIKRKYGQEYVDKLFPDEQISYYQMAQDWKNYVKFVNIKIKKTPPQMNSNKFGYWGDAWTLNHYAWQLFLNCDDKNILKEGLPWADLAIKLDTTNYVSGYYDTKANLLYRMGNVKEAIIVEEKALAISQLSNNPVKRSNSLKEFSGILEKMRAGFPTWKK